MGKRGGVGNVRKKTHTYVNNRSLELALIGYGS